MLGAETVLVEIDAAIATDRTLALRRDAVCHADYSQLSRVLCPIAALSEFPKEHPLVRSPRSPAKSSGCIALVVLGTKPEVSCQDWDFSWGFTGKHRVSPLE